MSPRFHKYTEGHFNDQNWSFSSDERDETKKNKPSLTFEKVVYALS